MKVVELKRLLRKIKSNFGISNLPQFKIGISTNLRFEIQTVLLKFKLFHSDGALGTKRCFVAFEILNNFCSGGNLTAVQILDEFRKKTERGRIELATVI